MLHNLSITLCQDSAMDEVTKKVKLAKQFRHQMVDALGGDRLRVAKVCREFEIFLTAATFARRTVHEKMILQSMAAPFKLTERHLTVGRPQHFVFVRLYLGLIPCVIYGPHGRCQRREAPSYDKNM